MSAQMEGNWSAYMYAYKIDRKTGIVPISASSVEDAPLFEFSTTGPGELTAVDPTITKP